MRIGVLGTGSVGDAIATRLVELGHDVKMGSRSATNETAAAWVRKVGGSASQGTFADAAAHGEMVFNCTKGLVSLEIIEAIGNDVLRGKILVDITNPLDFSKGFPPSLTVCNTDSLGEQIQRVVPDAHVVKTLNTMNAAIMVHPDKVPGEHDVFVSGNDDGAKAAVSGLLRSFGWKNIVDVGDISTARGTEMLLPIWVRLYARFKHADYNFHIQMGR